MSEKLQLAKRYYVTFILVAINVLIWIGMETIGYTENVDFMLNHGAMYPHAIEDGETYRLISSMFMHFGVEHLLNNMLLLIVIGYRLEELIGHLGLFITYMLAGIGGNYFSYYHMMRTGDFAVSAGASGAVFGIIGAMLAIVLIKKGKAGDLTLRGLAIMIALSLYFGFTAEGVDNVCHLAGLIIGFILGAIIGKIIDFIKKNQYTSE